MLPNNAAKTDPDFFVACGQSCPLSWPKHPSPAETGTSHWHQLNLLPSLKLTANAPENRPGPKRKFISQPSIFRGELLFRESISMLIFTEQHHAQRIKVNYWTLSCFIHQRRIICKDVYKQGKKVDGRQVRPNQLRFIPFIPWLGSLGLA